MSACPASKFLSSPVGQALPPANSTGRSFLELDFLSQQQKPDCQRTERSHNPE
jgi:hypothetical protein